MAAQIIQREWEGFINAIFDDPASVTEHQRSEMRLAFFGGAACLMSINGRIAEDSVSEESAVAVLESIRQELKAFQERLSMGERP